MRFCRCLVLLAVSVCVWPLAQPAAAQSDPMGYQALSNQLGSQMPTGSGVVVGHVEAPYPPANPSDPTSYYYTPDPANYEFPASGQYAKTFVNQSVLDGAFPSSDVSTHATTVAQLFYGAGNVSDLPGFTSSFAPGSRDRPVPSRQLAGQRQPQRGRGPIPTAVGGEQQSPDNQQQLGRHLRIDRARQQLRPRPDAPHGLPRLPGQCAGGQCHGLQRESIQPAAAALAETPLFPAHTTA